VLEIGGCVGLELTLETIVCGMWIGVAMMRQVEIPKNCVGCEGSKYFTIAQTSANEKIVLKCAWYYKGRTCIHREPKQCAYMLRDRYTGEVGRRCTRQAIKVDVYCSAHRGGKVNGINGTRNRRGKR